jgi:hypothetical protein
VVHSSSSVRVRGEFMKLGSSLVGFIWHSFAPPPGSQTVSLSPILVC